MLQSGRTAQTADQSQVHRWCPRQRRPAPRSTTASKAFLFCKKNAQRQGVQRLTVAEVKRTSLRSASKEAEDLEERGRHFLLSNGLQHFAVFGPCDRSTFVAV